MDVHPVGHRADEAEFVHLRRQAGQMLADLDAGDSGCSRPEVSTHIARGVGLHVPEVDLAGPSKEKQEDARASWRRLLGGIVGAETLQLSVAQAQ